MIVVISKIFWIASVFVLGFHFLLAQVDIPSGGVSLKDLLDAGLTVLVLAVALFYEKRESKQSLTHYRAEIKEKEDRHRDEIKAKDDHIKELNEKLRDKK